METGGEGCAVTLVISGFEFFQAVIYEVMFFLHCSSSTNFCLVGPFNLERALNLRKGLVVQFLLSRF